MNRIVVGACYFQAGKSANAVEGWRQAAERFARSVLRHIRVAQGSSLEERIMAHIKDINRHPGGRLPDMIRILKTPTWFI